MAFQFPASPSVGQVFDAMPGLRYVWNGTGWSPTTSTPVNDALHPDGTVAQPGMSWVNEPTAGFYRSSAGTFQSVIGGVNVFGWNATGLYLGKQLLAGDGTGAAPALSWSSESTAGFYRRGAGQVMYAVGGADKFGLIGSDFFVYGTLSVNALNLPHTSAISFRNGANTAYWPAVHHGGDDKLHIAWNGYPRTLIYGGGAANIDVHGTGVDLKGQIYLSGGSYLFNSANGNYGLVALNYVQGGERSQNWFYGDLGGGTVYLQATCQPGSYTRWYFGVGGSAFYMQSNGIGYSTGGWQATSDRRLKENIEPIADAMSILRKWTGYTFDKLDVLKADGTPTRRAGLLAQEVQVDLPAAVDEDFKEDERFKIKKLSLDHMGPIAVLVNAAKELDARLAALEEVAPLVSELTSRVKLLERQAVERRR